MRRCSLTDKVAPHKALLPNVRPGRREDDYQFSPSSSKWACG